MPYHGRTRTRLSNVVILFCVLVQGMVLYGVATVLMQYRNANHVATFAETRGQVVAVGLQMHSSRSSKFYTPVVTFRYRVGGTEYGGTDGGTGAAPDEAAAQREFEARYPAGQELPVYYNPDDPAEAVLYRAAPADLAAMFTCFGAVSLVVLPGNVWGLARLLGWLARRGAA